jgi:hypothetical protein
MATRKPPVLHVDGTVAITMLADSIKDLKVDLNRNFDLLVAGQKTLYQKFESHEQEDTKQFGEIKTVAAKAEGAAQAKVEEAARKSTLWMIGVTGLAGTPPLIELFKWLVHR